MSKLLYSTAIAAVLTFGIYNVAGAQGANPGTAGSGAQTTQQPGQSGSMGGSGAAGTTGSGMQSGSSTMGSATGSRPAGATAGTSMESSRMNEQQMRSALQARGYSDVSDIDRDGNTFKIGEAKRYGEKVEDLRVNAQTGIVQDEKRLSENQAKELLRTHGYSDVSDVKRDGNAITAKAKQGDSNVNVRIDAQTGTVTRQQASN